MGTAFFVWLCVDGFRRSRGISRRIRDSALCAKRSLSRDLRLWRSRDRPFVKRAPGARSPCASARLLPDMIPLDAFIFTFHCPRARDSRRRILFVLTAHAARPSVVHEASRDRLWLAGSALVVNAANSDVMHRSRREVSCTLYLYYLRATHVHVLVWSLHL